MISFLFLIFLFNSCFNYKELERGYKKANNFFVEVKDSQSIKLRNVEVKMVSRNDKFYPSKIVDECAIFESIPNGEYEIIANKVGYYSDKSTIEIINKGSEVEFKGRNKLILGKKKINKKEIDFFLNNDILDCFNVNNNYRKIIQDGKNKFTLDDIGKYVAIKKRDEEVISEHNIKIYLIDNNIEIEVDNKMIKDSCFVGQKSENYIINYDLEILLDQSVIELIEMGKVNLDVNLSLTKDSFKLSEGNKLDLLSSELIMDANKAIVKLRFIKIGRYSFAFSSNLTVEIGEFISKSNVYFNVCNNKIEMMEGNKIDISSKYYIIKMILKEKYKNYQILLSSNNNSKYVYRIDGANIFIHLFSSSKKPYIEFQIPPFNKKVFNPFIPYEEKVFDSNYSNENIDVFRHNNPIPKYKIDYSGRMLLMYKNRDNFYIFKDSINLDEVSVPNILFNEVFEGSNDKVYVYGLTIGDDKEKQAIVKLGLLQKRYFNGFSKDLDISDVSNNRRYLNGSIYLKNFNYFVLKKIYEKIYSHNKDINELVFQLFWHNGEEYQELEGNKISIPFSIKSGDNWYNTNSLAISVNCKDIVFNLSKTTIIDKISSLENYKKGIDIRVVAYGLNRSLNQIEIPCSAPLSFDDKLIGYENLKALYPYYEELFSFNKKIFPVISSQSFNIKISYSTNEEKTLLNEDSFYDKFVKSVEGDNNHILYRSNVAKGGSFGQSFKQIISSNQKKIDEEDRFNKSMIFSGINSLIDSSSASDKIRSGIVLLMGAAKLTKSYVDFNHIFDTKGWESNFVDSDKKEIEFINSHNQKNYSIKWQMYIFIPKEIDLFNDSLFSLTKSRIDTSGNVKVRVVRKIFNLKKELIAEVKESNVERSNMFQKNKIIIEKGWYLFSLKIDKAGKGNISDVNSGGWSINTNIPFDIFRHSDQPLDKFYKKEIYEDN